MSNAPQLVQKLWNYCDILRADGLSYGDFFEQETVAHGVNTALVALYWQGGNRIRKNVLREKRAECGEEILATLSQQLTVEDQTR